MPQVKVHGTLFPDQQHRDHNGGYRLAEDGGQRNTRHTHLEYDDEQQVQHHIDDTCHRQTDQRAAGVAHGTQQGGVEVVQHGHRHSDEVDLQVKCSKVNDILGAGHQFQQAVGCKKAHKSHQNAAHKAQGNSGLHRFVHALVILCTITAGRHNVCTQRKADKQVDQQVDECTVGTNCCQRGAAGKSTTTTTSAALNSSCKKLDAASGRENRMIFFSIGPLVRSPAWDICAMKAPPPLKLLSYSCTKIEA